MQKKKTFITTHNIIVRNGGTLWNFPYTLRDVYAFRVRCFSSSGDFANYGTSINIVCPDLLSGYRTGTTSNGSLIYAIAQIPTSPTLPINVEQHKHYTMIDMEIHHLTFRFVNDALEDIAFNNEDNPRFLLDLWHRNKHVD